MALATLTFDSQLLHRPVSASVLLPENAAPKAVLTFLHGYTDRWDSALYYSSLPRYCSNIPLAVVFPDAQCSFYLDTAYGQPYWRHLTQEIPARLKQWLRLEVPARNHYAAGISMGGYGAAKLAMQRPSDFAEVFLFSPVTDMAAVSQYGFDRSLDSNAPAYEDLCMGALLGGRAIQGTQDDLYHLLKAEDVQAFPYFHIYAGTEDFLYEEINRFVWNLKQAGGRADLNTSPGGHCWDTWDPFLEKMAARIAALL